MKTKTITLEIPEDKELVLTDEETYVLMDAAECQKKRDEEKIVSELQKDIGALYEKYKPMLECKYGVHVEFSFQAYRGNDRNETIHWVSVSPTNIHFIDREIDCND